MEQLEKYDKRYREDGLERRNRYLFIVLARLTRRWMIAFKARLWVFELMRIKHDEQISGCVNQMKIKSSLKTKRRDEEASSRN